MEERKGDSSKVKVVEGPGIMTGEGFQMKTASIVLGEAEDIAALYRERGFSEEAIKALLSGKSIRRTKTTLAGKELILSEDWEGKKEGEGH